MWNYKLKLVCCVGLGILVTVPTAPAALLQFVEAEPMPGIEGVQASSVAVSPDGNYVYVASGVGNSLVTFTRDALTGELTPFQTLEDGQNGVDGLDGVGSVYVTPDGNHVYTASTLDNAVAAFARDPGTGLLSFVEAKFENVDGVFGLEAAHMVSTSPDGRHVYVAAPGDDDVTPVVPGAVSCFDRDVLTGELTFIDAVTDEVNGNGVTGLDGVVSVVISPDGSHAYTSAFRDDAVAVFQRNGVTGQLSFVEVQTDNVGGVDGLDGANELAVSSNGEQVYNASIKRGASGENAVSTFDRNATTGALNFTDVQFDGVDGVDGLDQPASVTLAPNGKLLFTTGVLDRSLAIFRREPLTGQLSFLGAEFDGVDGVDGLYAARWADVSGDGKHVYVASLGTHFGLPDGKVAVFAIVGPDCDFDLDLACDIDDIDALVEEIVAGTNDLAFDLTGDGVVDLDDIIDPADGWLLQAGEENIGADRPYLVGDANLDERVDGEDFILWNLNKFTPVAAWSAGDFNADGLVDGPDFIEWNINKFESSDGVAPVPEPSGVLLSLLALTWGFLSRRRAA